MYWCNLIGLCWFSYYTFGSVLFARVVPSFAITGFVGFFVLNNSGYCPIFYIWRIKVKKCKIRDVLIFLIYNVPTSQCDLDFQRFIDLYFLLCHIFYSS